MCVCVYVCVCACVFVCKEAIEILIYQNQPCLPLKASNFSGKSSTSL